MTDITAFHEYYSTERGWTDAFTHAVAYINEQGGGELTVPAGIYETFPIELTSNMTLRIESGAVLRFINDWQGYPTVATEFEGRPGMLSMPCIYAHDAHNITVCGYGTIDGQGEYWWTNFRSDHRFPNGRPYLVSFQDCSNVKILDVTLVNSPAWTIHPLRCNNVEVRGITIHNPADSPNTDGINPDGCSNVRIADCLVDVGDDCVTLKAGTEETPIQRPCENITITNCNMVHGHGGVVIGSEMSGGVRNVTISNCVFQDTDRGIRVKTRRGRGGAVQRILINNLVMDRVLCPFVFDMYYRCGTITDPTYTDKFAHPVDSRTPVIGDIQIQNCRVARATAAAGFFYGLPESPVENVSLSNCLITMEPDAPAGEVDMMEGLPYMAQAGIIMRNARGVVFQNVRVENVRNADGNTDNNTGAWDTDDSVDIEIMGNSSRYTK